MFMFKDGQALHETRRLLFLSCSSHHPLKGKDVWMRGQMQLSASRRAWLKQMMNSEDLPAFMRENPCHELHTSVGAPHIGGPALGHASMTK